MKQILTLATLGLCLATTLFAYDGTVKETMVGGGYTYVLLEQDGSSTWVAGPETAVSVGDVMHTSDGMAMKNFHSRTLDRDFEVIYFVNSLGGAPSGGHGSVSSTDPHAGVPGYGGQSTPTGKGNTPGKPEAGSLEKAAYTVEEIYFQPALLKGQEVEVRGVVTRFNSGIMGSNWVHLMDGSGQSGTDDLTLTTQDKCDVGDQILIKGTLNTDKDLGAGYFFPVLIENTSIIVEKSAR
jgi:hypothetical protein